MKTIKINKGPAPDSELPRIVVKTFHAETVNQVTIAIATVILHESELGSIPSSKFRILKDRVEMSREAAIDFAKSEAREFGLTHIYDIPLTQLVI